ncbi:MAG: 30S ribosomal protein S20 [Candidatus Kerfeldbacteria bacterium]|nr:30S ribosomal protein S20 [Candidatus Kerfeldbacteria bacterium]
MPHTPAAHKALRQNARHRARNLLVLKNVRQLLHDSRWAIAAGKLDEAKGLVAKTIKAFDRAAAQGIVKPNTVARKKSRLVKTLTQAGKK